ncbi:MAG: UDP-N-acetylmuramate--L-alanine ligase [Gemmatimonadales bacterium]|nr:MAG: UDP-N-acetylmuramate--L-alanine ligase [Gemmatimonadales bacterium]
MYLFAPDDPRPLHFLGIAGAGMSALALIARRRGVRVTGCDADAGGVSDLAAMGIEVYGGHDPEHVAGARAVVYTAAVRADHPELEAARRAGLAVVRRADALAQAVRGGSLVAVAGTHGKTTTTAMVAEVLAAAGYDPTALVGGRVPGWGGNARLGGSEYFVVEADEYDRAFLSLEPELALITNVEVDHLECYGTLAAIEDAFAEFAGRARHVVVSAEDPGAGRVAARLSVPVWRVGSALGAEVRIERVELGARGSSARVRLPGGRLVDLRLALAGLHNVMNGAMAMAAAAALGADLEKAVAALAGFSGVSRRFELVGRAGGVWVVDDYAHHPTEVAATLRAARQRFPEARLVAVFQPHLYSRTQLMAEELGGALSAADLVVVTEVYAAREDPIPGVSGRLVAEAAEKHGAEVAWIPERVRLVDQLLELVREGDVVLTLGAGDITRVGRELLASLTSTRA